MNGLVLVANRIAQAWWPWMVASAWQGLLLLAVVFVVLLFWRKATSGWRYALLLVVLAKFVLPPVGPQAFGLFSWLRPPQRPVPAAAAAHPAALGLAAAVQEAEDRLVRVGNRMVGEDEAQPRPAAAFATPQAAASAPPALAAPRARLTTAAWLLLANGAAVVLMAGVVASQALALRRRLNRGRCVPQGPLAKAARTLARQMGMRRPPDLCLSPDVSSPYAGGLFRQFVILPEWAEYAPGEDLRALLAHELAHLRRRDPLVNWFQIATLVYLPWNPLVWWTNRRIRAERELCCDDLVLALGFAGGERYSRVLLSVAERMRRDDALLQAVGMADSFRPLKRRIQRALDSSLRRPVRLSVASLLLLAAFAAFVLPGSPRPQGANAASRPSDTVGISKEKEGEPPVPAAPVRGTVDGQVLKPDGSAAQDAKVEAFSWADWTAPGGTAQTDAEGRFTMQLAPGTYWFVARLGNLGTNGASVMDELVVNPEGKPNRSAEIHLSEGCVVRGKVVDADTGNPVEGARVVTDEGDRTTTDRNGAFEFGGLSRKDHSITAAREGLSCPVVYFDSTGRAEAEVLLQTKPGGTIRGKVTNGNGDAIVGALVRDHRSGSIFICGLRRTKTDAQGEFALGGYDPTQPVWSIGAEADGCAEDSKSNILFPAGAREVRVDFRLGAKESPKGAPQAADATLAGKLRKITGRVTGPEGKPVKDALVAYGSSTAYVYYEETKTDVDGNYTLGAVQSRADIVVAQADGLAPAIRPVPSDGDAVLDFQLAAGHWVEGQVVSATGKPISGVHLATMMDCPNPSVCSGPYRYLRSEATTGADGRFRLENLPENRVLVDSYGPGVSPLREKPLEVDRADHVLTLLERGQISGTVLRASDGQPVQDFRVYLGFPQNPRPGEKSTGFSAAYSSAGVSFHSSDGTFTVSELATSDTLRVTVVAPGFAREAVDRVTVAPVSAIAYGSLVIRLGASETFEGVVTEEDGKTGIGAVKVTLLDARASDWFSWSNDRREAMPVVAATDAQGRFKMDNPGLARPVVLLEKSGYGRIRLPNVDAGVAFAAKMSKAAMLQGTVLDAGGQPRVDAQVSLDGGDAVSFGSVTADDQGRFSYADLPPGQYRVSEQKDNRPVRTCHVELRAGDSVTIDWEKKSGTRLVGKVTQAGAPVSGVQVSLAAPVKLDNVATGQTDDKGEYDLDVSAPGTYRISFLKGKWMDPDKSYSQQRVEVAARENRLDWKVPTGSVTGRVLDKASGRPLAGIGVRATAKQTDAEVFGEQSWSAQHTEPQWKPENTAKTDDDGRFAFNGLAAGKWLLCATVESGDQGSGRRCPSQPFDLGDDEHKTDLLIETGEEGSARIALVDAATGKPATGLLSAICTDESGFEFYPDTKKTADNGWKDAIDEKGQIRFQGLPAGTYRVFVHTDKYPTASASFDVKAGAETTASVRLQSGGRLVFRIAAKSGKVPEDIFWIGYRLKKPGSGEPVLADEGGPLRGDLAFVGKDSPRQMALPLPPGEYDLEAVLRREPQEGVISSRSDLWHASQTVKIEEGRDTVVEVSL